MIQLSTINDKLYIYDSLLLLMNVELTSQFIYLCYFLFKVIKQYIRCFFLYRNSIKNIIFV